MTFRRECLRGFVTDWNQIQWHSYFKSTVLTTRKILQWALIIIKYYDVDDCSISDNNLFIIAKDTHSTTVVLVNYHVSLIQGSEGRDESPWDGHRPSSDSDSITNILQLTFLTPSLIISRFRPYEFILWTPDF